MWQCEMRVQLSHFLLLCFKWQKNKKQTKKKKQCYMAGRLLQGFLAQWDMIWLVVFCKGNHAHSDLTHMFRCHIWAQAAALCCVCQICCCCHLAVSGDWQHGACVTQAPLTQRTLSNAKSHSAINLAAHHLGCYDTQSLHITFLTLLLRQPTKKKKKNMRQTWMVPKCPAFSVRRERWGITRAISSSKFN